MTPPVKDRSPLRGRVYLADIGYGAKPWLVVSNNQRNHRLGDVLVVRITTADRPHVPTAIALTAEDPLVGSVLCDDLQQLYRDELGQDCGALSRPTMLRVAAGLRAALAL
jgi:mRNA interferase MazF